MQKKLIALAIAGLGLSSAAFAQTNVTLYGVADVTLESVSASGNAANANYGSFSRVTSNASYIGFKGTEDLGDGMKALFQFETGFDADLGVYSGKGRDTYVGLSSGYGTVIAGFFTGPTRSIGGRFEMLPGNAGVGTATSLLENPLNVSNTGSSGLFDTRTANAIQYTSPEFGGGFKVLALYSAGENKTLDSVPAGSALNGKTFELGGNYVGHGFDVGYAYGKVDTGSDSVLGTAAGTHDIKNHRLGAGYTFEGGHKVTLQWNKQEREFGNSTDFDQTSFAVEGLFKVTPAGSLIGSYTVARDIKGSNVLAVGDTGAKQITVGYLHALSKRTTVKAVASRISNDSAARYNFANGAVGAAGGFGVNADPKAFALGVRHSF